MRDEDEGPSGPHIDEDDAYVAAASLRDSKRRAKEEKYVREPGLVVAPEEDVDGKREIVHGFSLVCETYAVADM